MATKSSRPAPKKATLPRSISIETGRLISPQRVTRPAANYSDLLGKLKPGQCDRLTERDLYLRMSASAHTQNSKYGTGYVCRWLGAFGRIWPSAKQSVKMTKR